MSLTEEEKRAVLRRAEIDKVLAGKNWEIGLGSGGMTNGQMDLRFRCKAQGVDTPVERVIAGLMLEVEEWKRRAGSRGQAEEGLNAAAEIAGAWKEHSARIKKMLDEAGVPATEGGSDLPLEYRIGLLTAARRRKAGPPLHPPKEGADKDCG